MEKRDRLLRIGQVSEWTGISENTLRYWRARDEGEGPKAAKIGKNLVWRESDVQAWLDAQFEAAG